MRKIAKGLSHSGLPLISKRIRKKCKGNQSTHYTYTLDPVATRRTAEMVLLHLKSQSADWKLNIHPAVIPYLENIEKEGYQYYGKYLTNRD